MKTRKNKGFSLIEIVVAIAILGIIVLPLLNSFVTSSRVNAKARKKLRATEAAKNVLEDIRGYNIKEISESILTGGTTPKIESTRATELAFDGAEYREKTEFETSTRLDPVTNTNNFYPTTDKNYYFYLEGINEDGLKLNALLKFKGKLIKDSTTKSKITPIDTDRDILVDNTVLADDVLEKLRLDRTKPENIRDTATKQNISRKITIDIVKSGDDNATITAKFEYAYNGVGIGDISGVRNYLTDTPKKEIRGVYLFYSPWTESNISDKIVINNKTKKNVDIYIVRQDNAGIPAVRTTDISVNEESGNLGGNSSIRIYTNIPKTEASYVYKRRGILLNKNALTIHNGLSKTENLDDVNNYDRLYDVEVSIYDDDVKLDTLVSAKPLVTLTGGMAN